MFSRLLRPSKSNVVLSGAAAFLTGSAFIASRTESETVSECADNTVVGMLQSIHRKVTNIEAVLGTVEKPALPPKRHGIDIVLGAQWGDEGKGKLVDMLSQVRSCEILGPFIGHLSV
jgi:Adenylosuccinate synthetase